MPKEVHQIKTSLNNKILKVNIPVIQNQNLFSLKILDNIYINELPKLN